MNIVRHVYCLEAVVILLALYICLVKKSIQIFNGDTGVGLVFSHEFKDIPGRGISYDVVVKNDLFTCLRSEVIVKVFLEAIGQLSKNGLFVFA